MKKITLFFILTFGLPLCLGAQSSTTKIIKLGYIDLQKVIKTYPEGKKVLDFLKNQRDTYENTKTQMENDIKKLEGELESKSKELSEMQVRDYLAQIEAKRQELEIFINNANKDLEKKEKEMLTPVYQKVLETIRTESPNLGFNFIIDYKYVLIADPELDITEKIIKILEGK